MTTEARVLIIFPWRACDQWEIAWRCTSGRSLSHQGALSPWKGGCSSWATGPSGRVARLGILGGLSLGLGLGLGLVKGKASRRGMVRQGRKDEGGVGEEAFEQGARVKEGAFKWRGNRVAIVLLFHTPNDELKRREKAERPFQNYDINASFCRIFNLNTKFCHEYFLNKDREGEISRAS